MIILSVDLLSESPAGMLHYAVMCVHMSQCARVCICASFEGWLSQSLLEVNPETKRVWTLSIFECKIYVYMHI